MRIVTGNRTRKIAPAPDLQRRVSNKKKAKSQNKVKDNYLCRLWLTTTSRQVENSRSAVDLDCFQKSLPTATQINKSKIPATHRRNCIQTKFWKWLKQWLRSMAVIWQAGFLWAADLKVNQEKMVKMTHLRLISIRKKQESLICEHHSKARRRRFVCRPLMWTSQKWNVSQEEAMEVTTALWSASLRLIPKIRAEQGLRSRS